MLDDLKTCRATSFLGASWIVVFVAMHVSQWLGFTASPPADSPALGFGQVSVETAHAFGAMNWGDLQAGEFWRVLAATFVHYSALHLLMNLIGLMQLGWLMEPWYGSRQFLAVNLMIGGVGNLLGALMRQGFHQLRAVIESQGIGRLLPEFLRNGGVPGRGSHVTTGGGSTIILGLIGMAMIVGWRSRTRVGEFLRDQMLAFLGYTALIGVVLSKIVDNYGHAGGAFAGMALGFLHRKLVRTTEKGTFRIVVGVLDVAALLACFLLQGMAGTSEARVHRESVEARSEIETTVRRLQATALLMNRLDALRQALDQTATLKDPIGAPLLDWPPELPISELPGRAREDDLQRRRRQAARNLRSVLASFAPARSALDADLNSEPLEILLSIADDALYAPPSAKSLYRFEVVLIDLAKRAKTRFDELTARRNTLNEIIERSVRPR